MVDLDRRWQIFFLEKKLNKKFINISVPEVFVEQGSVDEIKEKLHLDEEGILQKILDNINSI